MSEFLHSRTTARGFSRFEFTDRNDVECSLQESSFATEAAIWLGCNDADPRAFTAHVGWKKIELPENTVANTRMHLTQEQVKELLPFLTHFAETGELPENPIERNTMNAELNPLESCHRGFRYYLRPSHRRGKKPLTQ